MESFKPQKNKVKKKCLVRLRGIIEESLLSLAGFKGCGVRLRNSGVGDATVGGGAKALALQAPGTEAEER